MNCHAKTNHPSIPNIMEQTLSKDVQEKLDMINWESLKDKYGISRDSFYNNPHLASQLVYGQMTDLVFAGKEDFSGMLSLRANMDTSGEKPEMKVKVFTMEKEKTEKDALYLYRQPITSEAVKKALFEKGEWIGPDGKKSFGYLNANGGRPITINIDGKPAADVFLTDASRQMTAADSVSRGFYYKQLQAPTDTTSFSGDTTIYINYVGKLLNGQVFDTNIARVAKDNYLYSTSSTYEPMLVNWNEDPSEITMGTDGNTVITGFAETIARMKSMEKGVGVFYSTLGYGYSGSGDNIPAYAPLIFEIELVAKPEE